MKPILFNTEMVRAILEGRKTVTRRVVKPCPISHLGHIRDGTKYGYWMDGNCQPFHPSYYPGDILYVRETWCEQPSEEHPFVYRASVQTPGAWKGQWRPSIHMPREAARIFLRVTSVRVERLQEIDGRGVLAEGVDNGHSNPQIGQRRENMQRMAFSKVWDSTIKPADRALYGWEANPWVWVIEFERISREEAV